MTAHERHPPHPVGGTIEVITGPMFSGKTEELLRRMRRDKVHMAAVLDEYGGVSGIVTLENVIEEIVGCQPNLGQSLHPVQRRTIQ